MIVERTRDLDCTLIFRTQSRDCGQCGHASPDSLALMSAGAYRYSMASFYNSYARPAEVLVKGDQYALIRERDTL